MPEHDWPDDLPVSPQQPREGGNYYPGSSNRKTKAQREHASAQGRTGRKCERRSVGADFPGLARCGGALVPAWRDKADKGHAPYQPWLGEGGSVKRIQPCVSQVKVMVRGRQHSRTGEIRAVSTGGRGQRAGRAERRQTAGTFPHREPWPPPGPQVERWEQGGQGSRY